MTVTELVEAAFAQAASKQTVIHQAWTDVSYNIGTKLVNSLLTMSVQNAGRLDILIRCMEDEFSKENPNLGLHNRNFLSELWIGYVYEFVRLLDQRQFAPAHGEFIRAC